LTIAKRERNLVLRLIALGIPTMVVCQAIFNLAVVTGLAPNKGIALPLLSAGGTGWILTGLSLGLVIAIDRTRENAAPIEAPTMIESETTNEPTPAQA